MPDARIDRKRLQLALARRWTGPAVAVALMSALAVAWRAERSLPIASPRTALASAPAPAVEATQLSPAERAVARADGASAPTAAPDDPKLQAQTRTRDARKESEFYADFVALGGRSIEALEGAAPDVLASDGPDCERVALLRALHAGGSTRTGEFFVSAIVSLPDASSPQGVSVPRFALRFLGERAAREPAAMRALEHVVWIVDPPVAGDLRTTAVIALAAAASESEIPSIASRLAAERDPKVRQSGIDALACGAHPDAARRALRDFGLSPTVVQPEITDG